jgi:hypothetical protein
MGGEHPPQKLNGVSADDDAATNQSDLVIYGVEHPLRKANVVSGGKAVSQAPGVWGRFPDRY